VNVKDEAVVEAIARALFRAHDDAVCAGSEPGHDFDAMAQSEYMGRPVIDGWRAAARAAIDLGARPRSTAPERLAELLGSDSTNFLGTGLTMREVMKLHDAEKLSSSWSLQQREERRRRLDAVMRLSVELARVRETTGFSTRLAEMAIESVIEGDWKMVEEWADHLAFSDEGEDQRQKYGTIYAIFRELLLQVLRAGKGVPA
jgi:hypothetical protein